jgi:hypothetical protein
MGDSLGGNDVVGMSYERKGYLALIMEERTCNVAAGSTPKLSRSSVILNRLDMTTSAFGQSQNTSRQSQNKEHACFP